MDSLILICELLTLNIRTRRKIWCNKVLRQILWAKENIIVVYETTSTYAGQHTAGINEYGCVYIDQTGNDAVQGFAVIIAALPTALRAAFAAERAARTAELAEILASRAK